jgi:hypothetical protein
MGEERGSRRGGACEMKYGQEVRREALRRKAAIKVVLG